MGRRIQYRRLPKPEPDEFQERTFFTPKKVIIIAALWLLLLACLVAIGWNKYYQSQMEPLLAVCNSKWTDVETPYTASSGIHPAIGVTYNGTDAWVDNSTVPWLARAWSLNKTQVVVCSEPAELVFLERCPYVLRSNPNRIAGYIDRSYWVQEVKLVEAKTGRTITTHTFVGNAPRACRETEYFDNDDPAFALKGAPIPASTIQKWGQEHLVIQ